MASPTLFKRTPLGVAYLISFLFALHLALPLYINSSFLAQFFPESAVGLVFVAASVVTIFLLARYPAVLNRFGNYKTMLAVVFSQVVMLVVLAFSPYPLLSVLTFVLFMASLSLVYFNLDIFMEHYTLRENTGKVRGVVLTVMNIAILLGPLMAGIILADNDFWKIYLIAAVFLIPVLFTLSRYLKDFDDPEYDHEPLLTRIKETLFAGHPNDGIRHVVIANLLMRFFISWMVIYTPIYLNSHIGFSWQEIGVILPIMLLPFILFELPVGRLIDKEGGERNIMAFGFFVAALFTMSLFFVKDPGIIVWAALLFGTRIGISFVEVASESYFFKAIDDDDTNILSIFRDTRPIAYIAGPLAGSVVLAFLPMAYLFPILSFVMLMGMWNSMRMA